MKEWSSKTVWKSNRRNQQPKSTLLEKTIYTTIDKDSRETVLHETVLFHGIKRAARWSQLAGYQGVRRLGRKRIERRFTKNDRDCIIKSILEEVAQMTEEAKSNLYDLPRIYHTVFPILWPSEIAVINRVFSTHSPFPVASILEPCCGTGRALVGLAGLGYQITGYDLNTTMVAYSNDRIKRAGLEKIAKALPGNMVTTKVEGTFDAAINLINSIGYLVSDEDVISHFRNTAACLRTGAVYLIHLGLTREHSVPGELSSWTSEDNSEGMQVTTKWGLSYIDRQAKVKSEFSLMEVADGDKRFVIDERHTMRMWLLEDLRSLAVAGGLRLEAVYDENGNPMETDQSISEHEDNMYFVFRSM